MATQTLTEAAKFITDDIVQGVAESIIDVNPVFASLPFTGYEGAAIAVNRENVIGDSQVIAAVVAVTAKTQSTYIQSTFTSVKIIGDAEMDGLIEAHSSQNGAGQMAIEVAQKAKSVSRAFQSGMVLGAGGSGNMNSFHSMNLGTQEVASATGDISFADLDGMLALFKSKDGMVDFIVMSGAQFIRYKALLRALGGTTADWVVDLPDGRSTVGYEGIPVFRNDYITATETAGGALLTTGALTSAWAGVWDDGSNKIGVAAIHPIAVPGGIQVEAVGPKEARDEQIIRVKQYANMALFNPLGLARLTDLTAT